MTYPNSGSLLTPQIRSSLSTQIIIKVGRTTVGAIQKLSVTQARDMWRHEEIGTDGVVEIHPKGAAKIDLAVTRVVFDGLRLPEAFARGFINIQSQRVSFDIQVIDRSMNTERDDGIIHIFHNCWFTRYSPTYQADTFIVQEDASIICERVTTSRRAQSAVMGGLRGISYEYDTIERSTDVAGRPGRLDSTGLTTKE